MLLILLINSVFNQSFSKLEITEYMELLLLLPLHNTEQLEVPQKLILSKNIPQLAQIQHLYLATNVLQPIVNTSVKEL